jgi:DNA-binding CsgD family transcriptional regulator
MPTCRLLVERCAAAQTSRRTQTITVIGSRSRALVTLLDIAERPPLGVPVHAAAKELLGAVAEVVRCDRVYWNRTALAPAMHRIAEIGIPHTPQQDCVPEDIWSEWVSHRPEHPIMSGRHGLVSAISDVYSPRQFRETWLYQQAFRPGGIAHEMGVQLSHPSGEIHVVYLSRCPGKDFDDHDRLMLRLVRPHLDAALRRIASPLPRLTRRETQVLRLLRDGLTDRQIARALGISEHTVGEHLKQMYARSGARSRVQVLALYASSLD